jgi:hypothetical protein
MTLPEAAALLGVEPRFWAKIEKGEGCWLWTAAVGPGGYGQFQIGRRPHGAHRVAWMLANGPIPEGRLVIHSCDVRRCVRPDHLRLGNHTDNMLDQLSRGRRPTHYPRLARVPYLAGPMTLFDAAQSLGLAPATLRRQLANGRLVATKHGRDWTVTPREVERYRRESLGKPGRPSVPTLPRHERERTAG